MRVQVEAKEVLPGDMIWFPNSRKPQMVTETEDKQGAERLVVLHNADGMMWHMLWNDAVVFKFEPDPIEEEESIFLDPDGNPT